METKIKQLWDVAVTAVGTAAHFGLQQAQTLTLPEWVSMGVGIAVIIFALTRTYFWWKHDGYPKKNIEEIGSPNKQNIKEE